MKKADKPKVGKRFVARLQKWVASLESGKFKQHQGALGNDSSSSVLTCTGHCCLGVLTKLSKHDQHPNCSTPDDEVYEWLLDVKHDDSWLNLFHLREDVGFQDALIEKNDKHLDDYKSVVKYITSKKFLKVLRKYFVLPDDAEF